MPAFIEPDTVRISVLGSDTQLDAGLPVSVPIAALMPDLLASLGASSPDEPAPVGEWTLARVDGSRLSPTDSLADAGVLDGELLLVRLHRHAAASTVVDDVADGVATVLRRDRASWSDDSALTVGCVLLLAAATLAVPVGRWAAAEQPSRAPVLAIAACAALVFAVAAIAGTRLTSRTVLTTATALSAVATAALSGSLVAPPTQSGAALAVAGVAAATTAAVCLRCTGVAPTCLVTAVVAGGMAAVGGTLYAVTDLTVRDTAAVIATVGVGLALMAPRLAIAAGRLPLPTVPATAPSAPEDVDVLPVDGVESLRLPSDQLSAIADLALGDMDSLARRTATTASILTGIIAAAVGTAGLGVVLVAALSGGSTVALAFCATVATALFARGRTHVDRTQSTVLVAGAGATAIAGTIALISADGLAPVTGFAVLLAIGGCAVLVGALAGRGEYSPLQIRAAEIAEYAVLASIVPLLLWVLDLYRAVRGL